MEMGSFYSVLLSLSLSLLVRGWTLTFNHVDKPVNVFAGLSQPQGYSDLTDGHADQVIEDHQVHGGSDTVGCDCFHFDGGY